MSHDYHQGLPGYDPRQILFDGCVECEVRAASPARAITLLDSDTFARAMRRTILWQRDRYEEVGRVSTTEAPLLEMLWRFRLAHKRMLAAGYDADGEVAPPTDEALRAWVEASHEVDRCRGCGRPVDRSSDETHFDHEEACMAKMRATNDFSLNLCDCDVLWHADCCPTCNLKEHA